MKAHASIDKQLKTDKFRNTPTLEMHPGSCEHFLSNSGDHKAKEREEKTLTSNGGAKKNYNQVIFILFDMDNIRKIEDS